jgi:hypothetical protein
MLSQRRGMMTIAAPCSCAATNCSFSRIVGRVPIRRT